MTDLLEERPSELYREDMTDKHANISAYTHRWSPG